MEPSTVISSLIDAIPVLRMFWRKAMHMEIEIKEPYSKAPFNTLPGMISETPILYIQVDDSPHIYMWADLVFINHRPDRREFILSATLHLKKRYWFFWRKTLAEVPLRIHSVGIEPTGPLLENLAIEPMSAPIVVTVDAKGPIQIPLRLSTKGEFCLEFRMAGPIRRIRRIIKPNISWS
jgi:hypothetical protein